MEDILGIGIVVQVLTLVAMEGTAREHEKRAAKSLHEHTLRGGDAIASVLGFRPVFGGASLVGQPKSCGRVVVDFLLVEIGSLVVTGDGDAAICNA